MRERKVKVWIFWMRLNQSNVDSTCRLCPPHSSIVQGSIMPVCKAASPQCIQLVNRESQRYELCSPFIGLSLLLGMGGQGLKGLVAAYIVLQQPFKLSLHSHTINKLSSHLLLAALGEAANPAGSTFSCDAAGPLSRSSNPSPAASIRWDCSNFQFSNCCTLPDCVAGLSLRGKGKSKPRVPARLSRVPYRATCTLLCSNLHLP